ncbi:MAG: ABC transporter ATP-binding protein [Chloroflexota bacterium]
MESTDDKVMIRAESLTKVYGVNLAIDDISFSCKQGEIVGFLGPNGSGKTTTMRILTGYMPPTSGKATIAGHDTISDSIAARQHLGYLPETVPLYPEMTVEDYLAFVARVRRLDDVWERVDDVLEAVDLLDRAESFIGALSKGMRQRVGLAQAMIHEPDVLILDEPTIGLDPRQVVEVRDLVKELGRRHTILLSTHILSEVEHICDRVIMIINGHIWADMPLAQIVGGGEAPRVSMTLANPGADIAPVLGNLAGVTHVAQESERRYSITYDGSEEARMSMAATAVNAGWGLIDLSSDRLTLEAVFLEKLREAEEVRHAAPGDLELVAEEEA